MAQLIVGMTPTLAAALARGDRTRDTTRLHHLTHQARLDLKPQADRALDPSGDESTVWYWAETGTRDQSDDQTDQLGAALEEIREIPGVTAAYMKPEDGPP